MNPCRQLFIYAKDHPSNLLSIQTPFPLQNPRMLLVITYLVLFLSYASIWYTCVNLYPIIIFHMAGGSKMRGSTIVASHETFITKEIHNNSFKKRYQHHRESVISEMDHTSGIIEASLDRPLPKQASRFARTNATSPTSTPTSRPSTTPLRQIINRIKAQEEEQKLAQPIHLTEQVKNKLHQIANISAQFEKACEPRRKGSRYICETEPSYSLPCVTPVEQPTSEVIAMEERMDHRAVIGDWKDRVKKGKEMVTVFKKKHPTIKFRTREPIKRQQLKKIKHQLTQPRESLRDKYYMPVKQERKSAPINGNPIDHFITERPNQDCLQYMESLEKENVTKLQDFVSGGLPRFQRQFGPHINVDEFKSAKGRFRTLHKMYEHVKQHNTYEFKDMRWDSFPEGNLLAMTYYIDNANNIHQNDKKRMRKQLEFVE